MIENKYVEAIVLQLVDKNPNPHRREFLQACLRNLVFEYEKNEAKFLEMNLVRDVCKVLIDEQGITAEQLPESWKFCAAKAEKSFDQIDFKASAGLIDCLTLLSNTDKTLARMHEIDLEALLPKIRLPQTAEWEGPTSRLEVLGLQLVTVPDQPEEESDAAAEEPPALAD
jgi:hypothetical protein